MDPVTCVQMVAGRMKLDNHFATNVIMGNLQGEMALPAVASVVSSVFPFASRTFKLHWIIIGQTFTMLNFMFCMLLYEYNTCNKIHAMYRILSSTLQYLTKATEMSGNFQ